VEAQLKQELTPHLVREMSDLKGFHSFAPIYFTGALLFFMAGGLLIFYDHPIIGVIIMVPGAILLLLSAFTFVVNLQLKKILKENSQLEKKLKQPKQKKRGP